MGSRLTSKEPKPQPEPEVSFDFIAETSASTTRMGLPRRNLVSVVPSQIDEAELTQGNHVSRPIDSGKPPLGLSVAGNQQIREVVDRSRNIMLSRDSYRRSRAHKNDSRRSLGNSEMQAMLEGRPVTGRSPEEQTLFILKKQERPVTSNISKEIKGSLIMSQHNMFRKRPMSSNLLSRYQKS